MTVERFSSALKAEPFRTFILHAADGQEYSVEHPELAMRTQSGRTVVVSRGEDSIAVLDLLLITAITFQETAMRP